MKSMNKQSGFTLIELVMVIVILGILAAAALPKFIDTTGDARQAAVDGVAGALASASAINYAASLAKGRIPGTALGAGLAAIADVDGCDATSANALLEGTLFAAGAGNYSISGSTGLANVGDTASCTVTTNDGSETATALISATK